MACKHSFVLLQVGYSLCIMQLKLYSLELADEPSIDEQMSKIVVKDEQRVNGTNLYHCNEVNASNTRSGEVGQTSDEGNMESCCPSEKVEIKILWIKEIESKLNIPFSWVVNNLMNPKHFLRICFSSVKLPPDQAQTM